MTKHTESTHATLTIRRAGDRGHFDHGWLDTFHTFSFGDYRDHGHMGFGPLRVINEDVIAPGTGFGEHPHRDMEIITWVLDGALEHGDSLGTRMVLRPGDVQVMTAGRGIHHFEKNAHDGATHLYQIWIRPKARDAEPAYVQRTTHVHDEPGKLHVLASGYEADHAKAGGPGGAGAGAIPINQDARVLAGVLHAGDDATIAGKATWVQVARGTVRVNANDAATGTLHAGDAAAIRGASAATIHGETDAEVLVFELAEG